MRREQQRNLMSPLLEENGGDTSRSERSTELLESLQTRAHHLLAEFRQYQKQLQSRKKQHEVEIRNFKRGIESEVKGLDRISQIFSAIDDNAEQDHDSEKDPAVEPPQLHALRSSNLPFYEAVWDVAKSCRCITALGKKVYATPKAYHDHAAAEEGRSSSKGASVWDDFRSKGVLVDIVAENGLEWIKVSTITERRLLFEMAKEGWEAYDNVSEHSGTSDGRERESNTVNKSHTLELAQVAVDLQAAARGVRFQFRHPLVRFVLPRLQEGESSDVDAFLADLRATGAKVQCGKALAKDNTNRQHGRCEQQSDHSHEQPSNTHEAVADQSLSRSLDTQAGPHVSEVVPGCSTATSDFARLMPAPPTISLSKTINLDCTILLALVSDICHLRRSQLIVTSANKSATYHHAILRQIEGEESSPLLPTEIYPLLCSRNLVCTTHAAQRMREIVQCMGTPSERRRAEILLGEEQQRDRSTSDLRDILGNYSVHPVPVKIQLPVKVVDVKLDEYASPGHDSATASPPGSPGLPHWIAAHVKKTLRLSPVNASVFLYGWAENIVTLTSNRTVAINLVKGINEVLDQEDQDPTRASLDGGFSGPQMYICPFARSLMGKSKDKK